MHLYANSFDHYGTGLAPAYRNNNTDGGWDFGSTNGGDNDWTILGDGISNQPVIGTNNNTSASGQYAIQTPPWGARRGDYAFAALETSIFRTSNGGTTYTVAGSESPRLSIPGASEHTRLIHVAFSMSQLPALELNHGMILSLQNSFGQVRGYIGVNPSGRLVIYGGSSWAADSSGVFDTPDVLAITSSPVIAAETWYSLNISIVTNGSDGTAVMQIYVGDILPANLVLNTTVGLTSGLLSNQIDVLGLLPPSMAGGPSSPDSLDETDRYIRDIAIFNTAGSYNNALPGQIFVAAQEMRAEDAGGGWAAFHRENVGDGVLNHFDASTGLRIGDNAAMELGSGDFTLEGFFRFHVLPTTGNVVLAAKWQEDDDNKSWKLIWDAGEDELQFVVSTDGATDIEAYAYPWVPDLNKYYHIAVVRESGQLRVFVSGTQFGVDVADASTYFDGSANFSLMSEFSSGNVLVADTALSGFADEVRLTVGVARYTTDFTPTTVPFGRNVVDDPQFNSVEVLMGFDGNTIEDESSNTFTVTVGTGVTADIPDDATNSFQVLNRRPAWDDTFVEASTTFATSILTLTAQPTDSETVTLGSITYTFRTSFTGSPANEVIIGTDTADTLSHLLEAVNGGPGIGVDYGTGTVANTDVFASTLPSPQVLFTATAIGAAGNAVASTETLANGSFPAATFQGGADIPAPSDFAMERLPVEVTGILALDIAARGYKSEAGSADLRFDLVGPQANVATGTAVGTDLNPSWHRQVFEEDPDTSATITPSTITGGRIRVTRTA